MEREEFKEHTHFSKKNLSHSIGNLLLGGTFKDNISKFVGRFITREMRLFFQSLSKRKSYSTDILKVKSFLSKLETDQIV